MPIWSIRFQKNFGFWFERYSLNNVTNNFDRIIKKNWFSWFYLASWWSCVSAHLASSVMETNFSFAVKQLNKRITRMTNVKQRIILQCSSGILSKKKKKKLTKSKLTLGTEFWYRVNLFCFVDQKKRNWFTDKRNKKNWITSLDKTFVKKN